MRGEKKAWATHQYVAVYEYRQAGSSFSLKFVAILFLPQVQIKHFLDFEQVFFVIPAVYQ